MLKAAQSELTRQVQPSVQLTATIGSLYYVAPEAAGLDVFSLG